MSYRPTSQRPFPVAGELDSKLVVSLSNGAIVACASNAKPLGVTAYPAVEAGERVNVTLLNTEGTLEVQATGQVDAGDEVVLAGAGKVEADPGTGIRTLLGMSFTSVSNGGVIEMLPYGYGHNLT